MPPAVGSHGLADEVFLAAFERCELPLTMFRHGDHLRFAWLILSEHQLGESLEIVRTAIRRFATHHGAAHIFHETMTAAWVHLLRSHREPTFQAFFAEHEHQLTRSLLHRFWTPEILDSTAARERWVPPDRVPLPSPAGMWTGTKR